MDNFANRLIEEIDRKKNPSIIGLDSDFTKLPGTLREKFSSRGDPLDAAASCMTEFNKAVIDAVHDIVPAVKIQSAFYEQYGPPGTRAFMDTAAYAREKGLIVVGDLKRNDIGNTSAAYSSAYIGKTQLFTKSESVFGLDAMTVTPYMGSDGIKPFVDDCKRSGRGIFVLVKTSNPSSSEIQDLRCGDGKVYERVAELVHKWGLEARNKLDDYSAVGAVVGATYPEDAAKLRKIMPHAIFLVPGYGTQGGSAGEVVPCFNDSGYGAIVHSARGVIFAYQKDGNEKGYADEARKAALSMKKDIAGALDKAGISPW